MRAQVRELEKQRSQYDSMASRAAAAIESRLSSTAQERDKLLEQASTLWHGAGQLLRGSFLKRLYTISARIHVLAPHDELKDGSCWDAASLRSLLNWSCQLSRLFRYCEAARSAYLMRRWLLSSLAQ